MKPGVQLTMEKLGKISEQVLSGIVQSIDAAVVLHDRQLNVVFINDSFRTIYEIDDAEVLGRSPMEFLPDSEEDQKRAVIKRLQRTLKTGKRSDYHEFTYRSPSGRYLRLVGISFPIVNGRNQITHVMSVIHNITARKKLEEEVIKAAKLASIAEMAYTLAHEINNPLTGMRLGLATLRQGLDKQENVQIVDNVMKDLNRIQVVVKSFLFSSRRPAELKAEDISLLEKIVKRILFHLSGRLEGKQIKVETKMCRANWGILMDKDKMHQVFLNLLLNAIDATPENGMIGISTAIIQANDKNAGNARHDPVLKITIRDTGDGIDPAILPKVMEPFYTTKHGGTGLGLPICKDIIQTHGGNLGIRSEPGSGTRVLIQLPVLEQRGQDDECR